MLYPSRSKRHLREGRKDLVQAKIMYAMHRMRASHEYSAALPANLSQCTLYMWTCHDTCNSAVALSH